MKIIVITSNGTSNINKILGKILSKIDPNAWFGDIPERVLGSMEEKLSVVNEAGSLIRILVTSNEHLCGFRMINIGNLTEKPLNKEKLSAIKKLDKRT